MQVFHLRDLLAGVLALAPARERALSALLRATQLDGGSAGVRARRWLERLDAGELASLLAIELPRASFAVHLDCLLGIVDRDAVLFDRRLTELRAWRLRPAPGSGVSAEPADDPLAALGEGLGSSELRQIEVADASEQWRHAANVLPLEPGSVVAYDHNRATNRRLEAAGIEVVGISGRELGRGRGGPRCLACPLARATSGGL